MCNIGPTWIFNRMTYCETKLRLSYGYGFDNILQNQFGEIFMSKLGPTCIFNRIT